MSRGRVGPADGLLEQGDGAFPFLRGDRLVGLGDGVLVSRVWRPRGVGGGRIGLVLLEQPRASALNGDE